MLEIADIRKRFGDVEALAGCAFSVERGRMSGFLGPDGAGKTTTMRAISGLVEPDSGEVRWDGQPVQLEDRLRFGHMPEERGLYPRMPVAEQVAYFGRLHDMEADGARRAAPLGRRRLLVQLARELRRQGRQAVGARAGSDGRRS